MVLGQYTSFVDDLVSMTNAQHTDLLQKTQQDASLRYLSGRYSNNNNNNNNNKNKVRRLVASYGSIPESTI